MKTTSRHGDVSGLMPPSQITRLSFGVCLLAMLLIPGVSPAQGDDPAVDGTPPNTAPPPGRLEVAGGALNPTAIRFTPPPPPKPPPSIIAEASSVILKPTHTITLVRGEPSTLPDIPPPRIPADRPAGVPFPPRRPEYLLGLSVTIYDRSLSHVKWRDPETKEPFEAWCGWDWGLVAPMQSVANDRVAYNLFFSLLEIDTARPDAFGRGNAVPDHPRVGADEFVFVGDDAYAAAPTGAPLMEAVRRYCIANRPALEEMRAARERFRADAAAWRKANPPEPESHTVWLKPHRGSRYLENAATSNAAGKTTDTEDAR